MVHWDTFTAAMTPDIYVDFFYHWKILITRAVMISTQNPTFHCDVHYPQIDHNIWRKFDWTTLLPTLRSCPMKLQSNFQKDSIVLCTTFPKRDHNHVFLLSSDLLLSKRGQLGTLWLSLSCLLLESVGCGNCKHSMSCSKIICCRKFHLFVEELMFLKESSANELISLLLVKYLQKNRYC